MNLLKTFFGQILRKVDVDFALLSGRNAGVQQNIDFTDAQGGVVSGLDVTASIDGQSVLITPGVFYTKGAFKNQNNLGGGERGELFSVQTFSGLPSTAPIRGQSSYLLVYAKITTQNTNPDPTKNQQITSSKNILTGENVPTRDYAYATIVVSNPILRSEISKYNGVPLALLTVDYNDAGVQLSNNGTIQNIITTDIKQPYVIGSSVDILNNSLVAAGVPDSFIVNRMVADNTLTASKVVDGSLSTTKLAVWDEATAYNDLTGSGVANQNLKDGAVTSNKLNYSGSLAGFSGRNRLFNSSFELNVAGSGTVPTIWNITNTGTSSLVAIGAPSDSYKVKYGNKSLLMNGGAVGASQISVDQVIDFGEDLTGLPITPSFWSQIKALPSTGTFLQGSIEFLNSSSGTATDGGPFIFATVSGTESTWQRYSNSGPIIYSGNGAPQLIRYKIGGYFNGSYYVDGAFLGVTDLLPEFDINPSEYTELSGFLGDITSNQIGDGTIATRHIRQALGGITNDPGNGIRGDQIRSGAVTGDNIQAGTITSDKLAPTAGLIPVGAIIIWDQYPTTNTDPLNPCPQGFIEVVDLRGRFPLGVNPATLSAIDTPKLPGGTAVSGSAIINTDTKSHGHSLGGPTSNQNAAGDSTAFAKSDHNHAVSSESHSHNTQIPYSTVYFCRKV